MLTADQLRRAILSGDPQLLILARRYLDLQDANKAAQDFKTFVRLFWRTVATTRLREGWYLDAICDHLQNLTTLKRLLINIPPRHGKSTLVSVLFPAWLWITSPEIKFICSSYSLKDLSTRDSVLCRRVITSPNYQKFYGDKFQLSDDQNTKTRFSNDHQGFRLATSTESANLGEGCDILIADDLNNVAKILSEADRHGVIHWWTSVMSTRMNPGGLDCKVVVQQRCHEEDITGHILQHDQGHDWTRLVLPWEYDPERRTVTSIWSDPRTTPGEPLSDLYNPTQIEEKKGGNGLGPTGFATQFNQRPSPIGGNLFQSQWFRTYYETPTSYILDGLEVRKDECHFFQTSDLAISLKSSADWTVIQTWCITPHGHLLLTDQYRERVEGPDAVRAFVAHNQRHRPDNVYVEDVAFQRLMIQLLKQQDLPVKAVKPGSQDKKARAQRALIKAECGQVWLPEQSPWLTGWLQEVTTFPAAAHDDQVDAFAWAGIVAQRYPVHAIPVQESLDPEAVVRQHEQRLLSGD